MAVVLWLSSEGRLWVLWVKGWPLPLHCHEHYRLSCLAVPITRVDQFDVKKKADLMGERVNEKVGQRAGYRSGYRVLEDVRGSMRGSMRGC